jgi:hypothetical protein
VSRNRSAWRRQWDANAPERAQYVELSIACDRHPEKGLFSQCRSTVVGVSMTEWVTGNPEQWTRHYADLSPGEELSVVLSKRCSATAWCRGNPRFRANDLSALLSVVAEEVSDGTWRATGRQVQELLPLLHAGQKSALRQAFLSAAERVRLPRRIHPG